MTLSALHSLHLCSLAPFTRRLVAGVLLPNQRPGMAVLLWAATPPSSAFLSHDPEVWGRAVRGKRHFIHGYDFFWGVSSCLRAQYFPSS